MRTSSYPHIELAPMPRSQRGIWIQTALQMGRAVRGAVSAVQYPYRKAGELVNSVRGLADPELRVDRGLGRGFRLPWSEQPAHFEAARLAADGGLSALARTLSDPDPAVRIRALDVICEFSPDQAVGLLTGVLHDPDPTVRCAGVWATPMVQGMGIVYPLILALEDPDERVRTAAQEALTEITGNAISLSESDPQDVRRGKLRDLKAWWKAQRMNELAAAAEQELEG